MVATIERDGGVIVRDFITADTLTGLLDDLMPKLEANSIGSAYGTSRTARLSGIFKHTRHADGIVRNPLYRETAERILCVTESLWMGDRFIEYTPNVQLGVSQLIAIKPGEGAQGLHRDDSVWLWRHTEGGSRQARLQIMVALSDFTAANGGTLVVPQSHLLGDGPGPSADEALPTEMTAGSALIFIGSTYHGGGANTTTDQTRLGLTFSLDLGNLRQEENHYLTIPVEEAKALPDDIQRLIGYDLCPPGTGFIEVDGQVTNPNALLG